MGIKGILRFILGDTLTGAIDYYRFPRARRHWGGPFNGQERRQELIRALIRTFKPVAIIETGTYLGTTTEFLAGTGIRVFSVEGNARFYGFARARLWRKRNVTLRRGDSRVALRAFFAGPSRPRKDQTVFAYLDAHWNDDLPLGDELDLMFSNCPAAVVMVDDFQVPHDPTYAYDDYGPGKRLAPEYIEHAVAAHSLAAFYPSAPAAADTGLRRGCVVLARRDVHGERLASLAELRPNPGDGRVGLAHQSANC
ncbi:MAG: hypothetical protein ABSD08_18570 [Xanthobacteraceae bacterium]|jgi:hypothetical protein